MEARTRDTPQMSGAVRIALPAEIAEELIEEGIVVPSIMTRGVGEVVQLVVDLTNTGGSLITVAAAGAALPKVMKKLSTYVRRDHPEEAAQVLVRSGGQELVVDIPAGLSLDDVSSLLTRTLEAASPGSPG